MSLIDVAPLPRARVWGLVGLFLAALALRPQVVGIGPLLPTIQEDLALSHAVAGLLGTIPVLCMGLFAPIAAAFAVQFGSRGAVAGCLTLIAAFGLGRAIAPEAWMVIGMTFGVGMGMGLAGVLLPMAVKEAYPDRPAFATGIYAAAIQLGAGGSAALAVPVAQLTVGWRGSLFLFSLLTAGLVAGWLVSAPSPQRKRSSLGLPRLPFRSGTAWILAGIFGLLSVAYYGLTTWLPASYVEAGWALQDAGNLVAVLNLAALPASLIVPWFADRVGSRRRYLAVASAAMTIGIVGVILAPDAGWLWVIMVGASGGALFPLILTLPLDVSERASDVGAVAGLMLGGGYGISALSPVLLGGLRDATGSFSASLWLMAAVGLLMLVGSLFITGSRLRRGVGRRAD